MNKKPKTTIKVSLTDTELMLIRKALECQIAMSNKYVQTNAENGALAPKHIKEIIKNSLVLISLSHKIEHKRLNLDEKKAFEMMS